MARKKAPEPEPEVIEDEKPNCYGTFDGSEPCLEECTLLDACRRLTGKLNSPTRGLSRKRAIRIFCRSCNGGSSRAGCTDCCCEFYPWLPEHRQLAGPPDLWWATAAAVDLDKAEREARIKKRTIKKDGFLPGIDEEGEEPEDHEEEDEEDDEN